jgi:hypothetical protein
MSELVLRAYGRTVAIAGPTEALALSRDRLPPAYKAVGGPAERRWEVRENETFGWESSVDGTLRSLGGDVVAVTEVMLSDLELWVAEHAKKRVFIHAGCVVANGKAIVLPGRTMSGKSSLTAALIRAGATYYSDEYAVFDHRGLVRPYPRKLAIRPADGGASERVAVHELGGKVGRGPAKVGLVAVLQYDAAAGWQPVSLTRGHTMLRLFDNAVAARTRPNAALTALEGATENIQMVSGTRGEADDAAELLLNMISP